MKSSRTGHHWLLAVVATLALQALSPSAARAQEPATVAAAAGLRPVAPTSPPASPIWKPTSQLRAQGPQRARPGPQRLDDDLDCAGAFHGPCRGWLCSTAAWSGARTCLSVLAQCLGTAGVVTILGGRSATASVLAAGRPSWGRSSSPFLKGVGNAPNRTMGVGFAQRVSMYQMMFCHHHARADRGAPSPSA